MKNYISKQDYSRLTEAKKLDKYANYICNVECRLGGKRVFKVEDTNLTIKMRCSQIGGMFSGTHCFVVC